MVTMQISFSRQELEYSETEVKGKCAAKPFVAVSKLLSVTTV